MHIVVISDEISDDFEEAVRLGSLLGINAYELRWVRTPGSFRRRRIGDLTTQEATELRQVAESEGAAISALSPGLLSGQGGATSTSDEHPARLEHCFRLAETLGTRDIILQTCLPPNAQRNGGCPPQAVDTLGRAAQCAEKAGFRLLLRNLPDSHADTGARTAFIVSSVHSPALAISWDPCHAVRAGEDAIADGYDWVAPFTQDVRVKDQTRSEYHGYEYTVLAQGDMDWPAQLQALARDGYQGTITLGAQLEPRLLSTMHSLEALRRMMESVHMADGPI